MENNQNQMQIDETFVRMAQQACLNSQKQRRKEIKGECYVSKATDRQKKVSAARNVILGVAAAVVISGGLKIVGDMDFEDDILKEVTRTETDLNTNGRFEEKLVYDDGFVEAMIDLDTNSLVKLYSDTSKEMKAEGNKVEAGVISEVVEEMEENYVQEHGRAK